MNNNRYLLCLFLTFASVLAAPGVANAEILFDDGFNFREVRFSPPLSSTQGDNFLLEVNATDSETGLLPAGTIALARNLDTGEEFVLDPDGIELFTFVPYSTENANADWIIELNSDIGSASAFIPAFGTGAGTDPVPGVINLEVAPGACPIMSWSLPANLSTLNDGNVGRIRARINDSSGVRILDDKFDNTVSATDYTTPAGLITG